MNNNQPRYGNPMFMSSDKKDSQNFLRKKMPFGVQSISLFLSQKYWQFHISWWPLAPQVWRAILLLSLVPLSTFRKSYWILTYPFPRAQCSGSSELSSYTEPCPWLSTHQPHLTLHLTDLCGLVRHGMCNKYSSIIFVEGIFFLQHSEKRSP